MVRTTELEKYLVEPVPLLENVNSALEKIQEYGQILTTVSQMDQSTINLAKGIKDPKNHSAGGVVALYSTYEGLAKAIDEALPKLDNNYKITVDGIDFNIRKKSLKTLWNYRLGWAEQAIGHLYFIYSTEIASYIKQQEDVFNTMKNKYKF